MNRLIGLSHPLPQSLNRHFADLAVAELAAGGHSVTLLDLYDAGFDPRLTSAERRPHYSEAFDASALWHHGRATQNTEMGRPGPAFITAVAQL